MERGVQVVGGDERVIGERGHACTRRQRHIEAVKHAPWPACARVACSGGTVGAGVLEQSVPDEQGCALGDTEREGEVSHPRMGG